ncbi:MAG: histidine phosphatase family protein [Pseudomonadota bacterium]
MRRLILMRHAKSSWSDPGQRDVDRPLNKRGQRDAPAIGEWLREKGYCPKRALVSTAQRTKETWEGLLSALPACPVEFRETLYHATASGMFQALSRETDADSVLMLGHQPGIGELAEKLLSQPFDNSEFARYPTSAVTVIDFDYDSWADVRWGTGRLQDFVYPKALRSSA